MPRKAALVAKAKPKAAAKAKARKEQAPKTVKVAKVTKPVKVAKARATRKRQPKEPNPLEPHIGAAVRYYDEGWRHGYIDSTDGPHSVKIRPITGIYSDVVVRCHKYPNESVTLVAGQQVAR